MDKITYLIKKINFNHIMRRNLSRYNSSLFITKSRFGKNKNIVEPNYINISTDKNDETLIQIKQMLN
jgi:hypothetical protein